MARKQLPVKDKSTPEGEGGTPKKSALGGIIKFALLGLVAFVAGGVLMFVLLKFVLLPQMLPGADAAQKEKEKQKPREMAILDLGDRVINLADQDGARYLRIRVVLEYPKEEKLAKEIEGLKPFIYETILNTLRSKTAAELQPVASQEKIKADIKAAVNSRLKQGKVENVYFTDFLIQ